MMETEGSLSRCQRPVTAGYLSRQRARSHNCDDDDSAFHDGCSTRHQRPTPARPSTQRNTRSIPRASVEAIRRMSGNGPDEDALGKIRSEVEALRIKLREADLAKSQAQVQLQRQGAEMAKLERYIGQLVDERGGVDDSVLENIVKDVERSSRVKSALKKVTELKSELSHKEKQIATLRRSQTAEYTLKLAEEKEALAVRVERLLAESNDKHRGTTEEDSGKRGRASSDSYSKNSLAELERLRTQNLKMRKETARLRATVDLAEMDGGGRNDGGFGKKKAGSGGASYFEGQAVECRKKGSDSWYPATIESARLTVEPLGRSSAGDSKTFMYSVYFDDKEGTYEDHIPESRLRRTARGDGDDDPGQGSTWVVKNSEGETFIRSKVFGPGDLVLVRNSGSGGSNRGDSEKWSPGEVVRRNDSGTYRVVVLGGQPEGSDFHPTMLRAQDHPRDEEEEVGQGSGAAPGATASGRASADSTVATPQRTKTSVESQAKEAEMQYAEKREELLLIARDSLPAPLKVGQDVLAKNGGSTVWGPGIVVNIDDNGLHCSVEFDFGDVEENIPCIFVRPRSGEDLTSQRRARTGDAVLAQKAKKDDTGGGDGGDWFNARFERYHDDNKDVCYVVFAGETTVSRVRAARVRPLFFTNPAKGDHHRRDEDIIPGNPPPPTKPVRAKKHHEGDVVLACIPKVKKWTPAQITGVKGRGRYSVEWADGTRADSLLFMFIASMEGQVRKGAFAVGSPIDGRSSNENESSGGGNRSHGDNTMSAAGAAAAVRLRQRALKVGEPVLARGGAEHSLWSPGTVTKVDGNGKYDVQFTDGTTTKDLSFLFVRALGSPESSGDGGESGEAGVGMRGGRIDSGASDLKRSSERGAAVGDTVYVLKRGNSPETSSRDIRNRDLWRVGTVTAATNGRFTVQYDGEEGKPKESRIVPARIRPRSIVRQKAAQKGDAVLALSDTPGRGWLMGAVTARGSDGKYTISFADGTQSDQIRFVNLRRVIGHAIGDEKEEDNRHEEDKPVRRAIRQRRFKKGELALARHPESRKWVVVKVLEALPSGRYDLEFLGDQGTPDAVEVPFQSIRHLDLARFTLANHVSGSADGERGSRQTTMERTSSENTTEKNHHHHRGPTRNEMAETRGRQPSDESWDEHNDGGRDGNAGGEEFGPDRRDEHQRRRQRQQHAPSDGDYDHPESLHNRRTEDSERVTSVTAKALDVGLEVYVLRRGKSSDAALEDKTSWRAGRVISLRSNGTFGVEYEEAGAPKEDRIAENRLRRRHVTDRPTGNSVDTRSFRFDTEQETFEEGDTVSAAVGERGGEERVEAKVEEYLGDNVYRVTFADGSGTREIQSGKLRHAGFNSPRHAGRIDTTKKAVKKRKLTVGQVVVARKRSTVDPSENKWQAAKVIKADGQGHYSVLFAGEPNPTSVHFTDVKPIENVPNITTEHGDGATGCQSNGTIDNNTNHALQGFLRVAAPSFDLNTTASAARRTSPCLILATGERRDAESKNGPWRRHQTGGNGNGNGSCNSNSGDQDKDQWSNGEEEQERYNSSNSSNKGVGFMTRSSPRPGSRNPAWKDGEFWLSLEGLQDPALFLGLEDEKKRESRGGGGREGVSEDAILAEACLPLSLEEIRRRGDGGGRWGSRSSGTVEVELNHGAGVVSLQWSTHKDTSSMRTGG